MAQENRKLISLELLTIEQDSSYRTDGFINPCQTLVCVRLIGGWLKLTEKSEDQKRRKGGMEFGGEAVGERQWLKSGPVLYSTYIVPPYFSFSSPCTGVPCVACGSAGLAQVWCRSGAGGPHCAAGPSTFMYLTQLLWYFTAPKTLNSGTLFSYQSNCKLYFRRGLGNFR